MYLSHNSNKFHVTRMQAKFCRSCPRHVEGWVGLVYVNAQIITYCSKISCRTQEKCCLKDFLEAFWQSSNLFDFRWSLKSEEALVQSRKAKLTIHSTLLKGQTCSFSAYLLTRTVSQYVSTVTCCSLKWLCWETRCYVGYYPTLTRISVISQVFDELRLQGLALYWEFPSVNIIRNFCSDVHGLYRNLSVLITW
jgi:hypothetical protein